MLFHVRDGIPSKSAFEINKAGNPTGPAFNVYEPPLNGSVPTQFTRINMGGCMGCHGRTERAGTDFSFTLSGGPVATPEFATPAKVAAVAASNTGSFRQGVDRERLQELHDALSGR